MTNSLIAFSLFVACKLKRILSADGILRAVTPALLCAFALLTASAARAAQCDPTYVRAQHKTVAVLPTGGNDTANLQCAFDLASSMGPGVTIQLAAGTFTTAQLVVDGVRGVIRGAGQDATIIYNPATPMPIDNPHCGPGDVGPCFADHPPSATNRYPTFISILGKDVVLSDLKIEMVGRHLTDVWSMWGFNVDGLSEILQFYGSHATLWIKRVEMTGEALAPDAQGIFGGVSSSVLMWSFSRPWFVTGSTLVVADSLFRTAGGVFTYNLDNSRATLSRNRFEIPDYGTAWILSDMRNSQFMASHNEVVPLGAGVTSVFAWPGNIGTGIVSSSLFFNNNVFAGETAVRIEPDTFKSDVNCLAVNNDISQVTGEPYVLNGNSCRVVGQH